MWDIVLFSNVTLGQAAWLTFCALFAGSAIITAIRGYETRAGEVVRKPYGWKKAVAVVLFAVVVASPVLVSIFIDPDVPLLTAVSTSPIARVFLSVVALVVCGFFLLLLLSIPVSLYRSLAKKTDFSSLFPEANLGSLEAIEVEGEWLTRDVEAEWLPREERLVRVRSSLEAELKDPSMTTSEREKCERVLRSIDSVQKDLAKRSS